MAEPCSSTAEEEEDKIVYQVKYDDYPENGVLQMSAWDRNILPWQELNAGQMVMLNYTPTAPRCGASGMTPRSCASRRHGCSVSSSPKS